MAHEAAVVLKPVRCERLHAIPRAQGYIQASMDPFKKKTSSSRVFALGSIHELFITAS